MITKLRVTNFKSHKDTSLNLGNITILSGLNSTGKSSIIQTMLLLRQSYKKGRLDKGLDLNVNLVDIGKGSDALFQDAKENEIITFEFYNNSEKPIQFQFDVEGRYDDSFIPRVSKRVNPSDYTLPFFLNDFQYLSANRIASQEFYPVDSYSVEEEKQISLNYGQGELVAHFLEYYGNNRDFNIELDSLLHNTNSSRKLLDQVIAWEQEISPRLTISARKVVDKIVIEYGYKSQDDSLPLTKLKSFNVGFGISYSLAIVVAILSSKQGSLLLIENPEAHLHPRGQSKLTELMCLAASCGIQIVVESHSDHVFNGLRKALKSKILNPSQAKVHFFETTPKNVSNVTEILLSDEGRVLNHQKGLFDQFDDDLDNLLGL